MVRGKYSAQRTISTNTQKHCRVETKDGQSWMYGECSSKKDSILICGGEIRRWGSALESEKSLLIWFWNEKNNKLFVVLLDFGFLNFIFLIYNRIIMLFQNIKAQFDNFLYNIGNVDINAHNKSKTLICINAS